MSESAPKYRRNVAAVILDADGYVLVGRKKEGSRFIHFPQGGVGKKETFEEALWREIYEEVGISRHELKIVARLAGLSYDYRKRNKKREKWAGQEQTYYLIRCTGDRPQIAAHSSTEFGHLEWIPSSALSADMFVSFKRNVIEEVLAAFFPQDMKSIDSHIASLNVLTRYRYTQDCSLSAFSPYDRELYAGGKEEALSQMSDLQTRIRNAQSCANGKKILVLILDADKQKRRINCLRRIGSLCDPLCTRVERPGEITPIAARVQELLPALARNIPAEGEMLITADSVYLNSTLLTQEQLANIADFEHLMVADGVTVLKFFLHITPEQRAKTADDYNSYIGCMENVLQTTACPIPWYVVPSEKKWYRDYVIASIIAEIMENIAKTAENVTSGSN